MNPYLQAILVGAAATIGLFIIFYWMVKAINKQAAEKEIAKKKKKRSRGW